MTTPDITVDDLIGVRFTDAAQVPDGAIITEAIVVATYVTGDARYPTLTIASTSSLTLTAIIGALRSALNYVEATDLDAWKGNDR